MPFNGFQQFKNAATESSLKNLDENFFKSDPAVFQNILSWLDKLTTAKEFTDQKSRPYFAERVLSILQFAQTNPEYFETFKAFLIGALGSCVDRASLPLNYLELQKKIHESKDDSLENLIAIFKGGLALDQIPFIASKFMESHSEADEIEVHLGLQTKMKEIFNLPIALSSMNYFGCSHLKEKDLDEAEIQIKNALQDKEKAVNYLISNKIWEEKLKTLFREDLDTSLSGIQKELKKLNKKYSSEKEKMLEQDFIKACADLKDKHVQLEKAWILDRTIEVVEMHWLPNTSNYIITDLF